MWIISNYKSLLVISLNFYYRCYSKTLCTFLRLQETWCDQQVGFILCEVNNAQDKLENYIKKEINDKHGADDSFRNHKLEPTEGNCYM